MEITSMSKQKSGFPQTHSMGVSRNTPLALSTVKSRKKCIFA
uniref:Uncharacterized protein n=1 Tax=Rhizophora mucronata TaxID=61149 RepID=A0A2P2R478_RHIMU